MLPSELPPDLVPFSWLIGAWEGGGKYQPPGTPAQDIVQQVVFGYDGRPVLTYSSRILIADPEGGEPTVVAAESGYWHARPDNRVEVVISDDTGIASLWQGFVEVLGIDETSVTGARARLAADQIVRSALSPDVTGAHRLYGFVEGRLLWVLEQSHGDADLVAVVSAELDRVDGGA